MSVHIIVNVNISPFVGTYRDYNPNWMTSIEMLDEDTYIGAENAYNLFVARRNSDAPTDEDRSRLELTAEFHLGEFVNRFRHGTFKQLLLFLDVADTFLSLFFFLLLLSIRKGSLVMKMAEPEGGLSVQTSLIYGTVNGAIGVIATLPEQHYQFFSMLQHHLNKIIKGVGGFTHEQLQHCPASPPALNIFLKKCCVLTFL